MIDRRSFLAALGAALAAPDAAVAEPGEPIFVSACTRRPGEDAVAAFGADGRLLFETRLPARGHDVAARPGSPELVVFARRPGNWAAVVDRRDGQALRVIASPPGRHFYGHGLFSADGALLFATENAMATGEGRLGLYDAQDGYRRVGELPTHGIGPHDLAPLPGGGILVANGGIRTHPESGREILNPDAMEPGLAVLDPRTGDRLRAAALGPNLRGLSLRHLAVAPDGTALFGCQWEGDPAALTPLVGLWAPDGEPRFLDMPDDDLAALDGYVGSVRLDRTGRTAAATSPRGGAVALWDVPSGRFLGRRRLPDVCGVAPAGGEDLFVVTSGNAGVRGLAVGDPDFRRFPGALGALSWDNHLVRLPG